MSIHLTRSKHEVLLVVLVGLVATPLAACGDTSDDSISFDVTGEASARRATRPMGATAPKSPRTRRSTSMAATHPPRRYALVFTGFNVSIPDDATILGIRFMVRRNADDGSAVDDVVRVLKEGAAVGLDRSQTQAWPRLLSYAEYGGPTDNWGVAWQPEEIRAAEYGISVAPRYTGPSAGNDRAHIDSVRATVFYTASCE
jgi:hypothetical protein